MKRMKSIFRFVFILLLWMPLTVVAQEQGIRFDKSMSWKEVVEKATRENKYIYVDVMSTWCPGLDSGNGEECFPRERKRVIFNNQHFICIKLQTDKTAKDDEYVKAWYKEVNNICTEAKIQVLPTALYYNPKGELVHIVPGGIPNVNEFIKCGQKALDENQQILPV